MTADPDEVLAGLFPVEGPHTQEKTVAAADAISELVRYLNHATGPRGAGKEALPFPADVDRVLGSLESAFHGLMQTFPQLAARLEAQALLPGFGLDRVGAGVAHNGPVRAAVGLLRTVPQGLDTISRDLGVTRRYTARMSIDDTALESPA
jgi:hypothetical protein